MTVQSREKLVARLREWKVGDRVTILSGRFAGKTGRISQRAHADVRPRLEWIVDFDETVRLGRRWWNWTAVHSSELGAYAVPESARPYSVGVLQHPAHLYLDRHVSSDRCNVCSAEPGAPCFNLFTGQRLADPHIQAPRRVGR